MKVTYKPVNATISQMREKAYLTEWPVEKQLEAFSEAEMGQTEKLEALKTYITKVKAAYPYNETE